VAVFTPWVVEEVDKTMAQHQRQEDNLGNLWDIAPRRVARKKEIEQFAQYPQTGPLPVVSISDYTSWYDYVDALEQQRQMRHRQEEHEHARHITNTLASIMPSSAFQQRDTDTLAGITEQATVRMPAVTPSPERSRETKALRMIDEIIPFLDHAIRLFAWQYNTIPTHIRLSVPSYQQLCQKYGRQISAYTNERGTFHLILDSHLDALTIVCEEHVMQQ
jgi:hypothetical protein